MKHSYFDVLAFAAVIAAGYLPTSSVAATFVAGVGSNSCPANGLLPNAVRSCSCTIYNSLFYKDIATIKYVDRFAPIAVLQMQLSGIPASITLAQAIIESGSGNSRLAKDGNNHFGIKVGSNWSGRSVEKVDDDKNPDGSPRASQFRAYDNAESSYADHVTYLHTRQIYASLFHLPKTDYKSWAHGLQKAGYATNPEYANLLIKTIEEYELARFDTGQGITTPVPQEIVQKLPPVIVLDEAQLIRLVNGLDMVVAGKADNAQTIAKRYAMSIEDVLEYNELTDPNALIAPGSYIYLMPKQHSNPTDEHHKVAQGETLYSISQQYGVKLVYLRNRNLLNLGEEPAVGAELLLGGKATTKPPFVVVDKSNSSNNSVKPLMMNAPMRPKNKEEGTANTPLHPNPLSQITKP